MWLVMTGSICAAAGVLCVAAALRAEPPVAESGGSKDKNPSAIDSQADPADPVSIAVARDRAKVMHDVYAASLEMMHHRYFHRNRAVVPARAMEDVFKEIKRQSNVEARWIAVNMKAMSINHVPESEFEKEAAREIAAGKPEIEIVEGGYYRRAGAIPLANGCIGCHGGLFSGPSKTPKFAGLIISVPVVPDSDKPK